MELELSADPGVDEENEPRLDQALLDLTKLCSLAGLDELRKLIEKFPDDPEIFDLAERLLATAIMNGVSLPEAPAWRKRAEALHLRVTESRRDIDPTFYAARQNRARQESATRRKCSNPAHPTHCLGPTSPARPCPWPILPSPPSNRSATPLPRIGRNDPCPCGSGKKYKKCCGMIC